jgi:hypothetical protein
VWLLWLEPWNFVFKKSTNWWIQAAHSNAATAPSSSSVERHPQYVDHTPTSSSTFTHQWEAYVAANLHFYTVPLAIFLRRAKELFICFMEAEFSCSLALVQRVLRCYPEPIVKILTSVLSSKTDTMTRGIVSWHVQNLGPYYPLDDGNLVSCQADAMDLVEYIFARYEGRVRNMTVIDHLKKRVGKLRFGQRLSEEGNLQSILSQLKCIVGLPQEYQVSMNMTPKQSRWSWFSLYGKSSVPSQIDLTGPERTPDGLLTDLGRRQIATGTRKCSPFDVRYIGDPMLAPYCSYEIPALVDLAIALSTYVNGKLGFVPKHSFLDEKSRKEEDMLSKNIREMKLYNATVFRFNLRFLADYRNLVMLSCGILILRTLW